MYTPTEEELRELKFEKDYDNFECEDGEEHSIPFYTLELNDFYIIFFNKEWYWDDMMVRR